MVYEVLRSFLSNKKIENMSDKEFDIPEEPSVTSEDPNERKLARRLRIQRRLEALKKQEGSEDEAIIEKTQTEKQIEISAENLKKLIAEGNEIVSNVRVANDAREVHRRAEEIAIRDKLLKKLEEEANDSLEKYRNINEKWSILLKSKDPLDVHAGIESQNVKCREILEQKDLIVEELKEELKNSDDKFCADQKKQSEDINLLIERIDHQSNAMAKAYRRELVLIEEALDFERKILLESVTKKWDTLYKQRQEDEMMGVEKRKEIMKEYEAEMKRVIIEHQEKYRAQKIELETECQNLQQEVQNMKALCMMNIEKLDYSYAVLKRREDENMIVKNQQKRRINKLQDVINGLKKTYNELEENTRLEIQKLSDQVYKTHKNIIELEAKSEHFTRVNEKQYLDIWDMNTSKANELVEKILTADRIIYEQTLGLDWEPPELTLLKKEDLPSYRKAMAEIQQKKEAVEASKKILEPRKKPTNLDDMNRERLLLNHILRQISDHTGFLIEDRLEELLAPHTLHDNIIIRLDNVFQALGIKSEDQIDLLLFFFLPYSYCVTCATEEENVSIFTGLVREESTRHENTARNICSGSLQRQKDRDDDENVNNREIIEVEHCEDSMSMENTESDERMKKIESRITSAPERSSEDLSTSAVRRLTCKKGHLLQIETANVTRAFKEFLEKCQSNERGRALSIKEKLSTNKPLTLSRSLTNEDITNYWKRYRDIFSTKKEKLWDGLLIGLHKYHNILKERHKLNNETECLRKQNAELRRLLETYAPVDNPSKSRGSRASNKSA